MCTQLAISYSKVTSIHYRKPLNKNVNWKIPLHQQTDKFCKQEQETLKLHHHQDFNSEKCRSTLTLCSMNANHRFNARAEKILLQTRIRRHLKQHFAK